MLQGAGERLRHLNRESRRRIVRQPMILTRLISELGLEEKLGTRDDAGAVSRSQRFTDSHLEVVPPLIRRVDAAKSGAQRKFGERSRAFFLPRCSVKQVGNSGKRFRGHRVIVSRVCSPLRGGRLLSQREKAE